ncbi:ThiF family adenylyltransferase [Chroococcus sp. FPU101]|uniref:ThiF family adenylyltransferase n=1 Tax=Chroococcus sp. FPU101 TaxID=1974212 RepID=UPI001A8D3C9A|nr:ThiF family adenylyltransferase [Chroococcus sp. FPU101]GFE67849.1 UBA/THIF-type NAD/FAD binding protein [Chroococcus sp. FPU101]
MTIFFHEQLYRTNELMKKVEKYPIAICGAGALGANITENLARSGFSQLKVIDYDRIEERNLSTQPYYRSDVGAFKAKILANHLYRAVGVKIVAVTDKLTLESVTSLLKGNLVIDAFDNSVARGIVKEHCERKSISCLHTGLSSDYAEIIWNESYRVPSDVNDDICDYPLARNLVMLTVAVTCETVINFIATKQKLSHSITLKDLSIQSFV